MVSVSLPSDALLQHLPSYLGFSYLGCGVSLHGCSSKVLPLLLTLDEGYLLTTTLPDLQRGMAPLGPPVPTQPLFLGHGVAPPGRCPWPQAWGCSSQPPPQASGTRWLLPSGPLKHPMDHAKSKKVPEKHLFQELASIPRVSLLELCLQGLVGTECLKI